MYETEIKISASMIWYLQNLCKDLKIYVKSIVLCTTYTFCYCHQIYINNTYYF